jgi:hypothetical protein
MDGLFHAANFSDAFVDFSVSSCFFRREEQCFFTMTCAYTDHGIAEL